MKVVKFSALHKDHLNPPPPQEIPLVLISLGCVDPIENRTRHLLACNAVPQPTALQCTQVILQLLTMPNVNCSARTRTGVLTWYDC